MPQFNPNETTRSMLLHALDMLIEGTNIEEANTVLQVLEDQYREKYQLFSLDRLFFGALITLSLDDEFQSQTESLIHIRSQLTGKQPHWGTYALKYDFTEFFSATMLNAFQQIAELLVLIEESQKRLEHWEHFDNLHEDLYTFLFEILVPTHLSEMLQGLLIHAALVLPIWRLSEIGDTFDAANSDTSAGFSLIWPPETIEDTYLNHTQYLRSLIRKIKGEEIVYVDLTIVPNHSMLNIR
jgi:hypothetical protein